MTEEAKKKRDELADLYGGYTYDHGTKVISFKNGFDAGYQVAMEEANENNELVKAELNLAKVQIGVLNHIRDTYEKENAALKSRIERLRTALEFYGDREESRDDFWQLDWELVNNPAALQDKGKTARAALKEDEALGNDEND